ncbi:MAG TPA: hypothetical protein VNO14_10330 [Blastocatellia bacterium]|nr:hypothetical protein [Blastocatellia bacterium]
MMRIRVYSLILSAMLIVSIWGAGLAHPLSGASGREQKKEKVQLVVVEKREREEKKGSEKSGSGSKEQRPRNGGRSRT